MAKPGGPLKLTPLMHATLVAEAASGLLYDAQIAVECGITPGTLERWLLSGLAEDAREPYKSFAEDWTRAQNKVEKGAVKAVLDGTNDKGVGAANAGGTYSDGDDDPPWQIELSRGDWKAAAWYLERRYPRRYALSKYADRKRYDSFDVSDLLLKGEERKTALVELFRGEIPPELAAAMREARIEIQAVLATSLELPEGED